MYNETKKGTNITQKKNFLTKSFEPMPVKTHKIGTIFPFERDIQNASMNASVCMWWVNSMTCIH